MSRSAWKPPFCHPSILKSVNNALNKGFVNMAIKVHSRASVIIGDFIILLYLIITIYLQDALKYPLSTSRIRDSIYQKHLTQ